MKSPQFLSDTARVDSAAIAPLPASTKIYVAGSRPDIRVPMREIALSPTPTRDGFAPNAPLAVYDTSGPYTDPEIQIDIRRGLPEVRRAWIDERGDTEWLDGPSSTFGRRRAEDPRLSTLRFQLARTPRRARPGANVTQLHYARRGIVTPEMEFIAIRENQQIGRAHV